MTELLCWPDLCRITVSIMLALCCYCSVFLHISVNNYLMQIVYKRYRSIIGRL